MHSCTPDECVDGLVDIDPCHCFAFDISTMAHRPPEVNAHNPFKPEQTRMWANAQSDGRPAEHRWRPLFNAAKFG